MTGELFPRSRVRENAFCFQTFSWEKEGKIYEMLKIKKWKKKLIDMSKIMKYSKVRKEIGDCVTSKQVAALIKETCIAEASHWFLCIASLPVRQLWNGWLGFLIWFVYCLGNLPYIIVQRYNRPNLKRLYQKMIDRENNVMERRMRFD